MMAVLQLQKVTGKREDKDLVVDVNKP